MTSLDKAQWIVHKRMLENDAFSKWMEIEVVALSLGSCTLIARIRQEMLNGFGIAHGGIAYALADSALAFASNSHGLKAVSIETSISHTKPVHLNDTIQANAVEKNLTKHIGIYEVILTNQHGQTVALFKGTVYRSGESWEL
ncbi:MAG TPA: hotdog fold thioesterase [Saprospiraceae bacterium]|nr:hotdog fold thioesterase [Saprospiraceae bacterium]HRO08502.1 hotdog fold thioesterase [Saprospiraceae bacterium]HRP41888.1 hotdog fold thioesterase [Saprospiraceae bacterium]